MIEVVLKRFESPDEVRIVRERASGHRPPGRDGHWTSSYEPGWKWSQHVGPQVGAARCSVEHVGMVLSGAAVATFEDGTVTELREGSLFHIPAVPHDSWVVGGQAVRLAALLRRRPVRGRR